VLTQLDSMCVIFDLPIFNIVSSPSQQVKKKLTQDAMPTTDNMVRSPIHVKRKGQPRTNRLQSIVEKVSKKRKCRALSNKSTKDHGVSDSPTSLPS